jgi:hypothetical protein
LFISCAKAGATAGLAPLPLLLLVPLFLLLLLPLLLLLLLLELGPVNCERHATALLSATFSSAGMLELSCQAKSGLRVAA